MTASIHHMELLDQRLAHAHRSAISEELARRGLGEVGHPMLLTILKYSGESDPDRPWRARCGQLPEVPGTGGLHQSGAGAAGRPSKPGPSYREGTAGGGGLPGRL